VEEVEVVLPEVLQGLSAALLQGLNYTEGVEEVETQLALFVQEQPIQTAEEHAHLELGQRLLAQLAQ